MKKSKRIISLFLVLVLISSYAFLGCSTGSHKVPAYNFEWTDNGDIEIIKDRVCAEKMDTDLDVTELLADMAEDGSYKSIDYYTDKRNTWHPLIHLQNTLKLQIASHTPGNKFYQSEEVKNAVTKAIKFWIEKDFYCDWNWWYNSIGVGLSLPDILLYGVEGLSKADEDKLLKNVKSTLLYNQTVPNDIKYRQTNSTGGNLTDDVVATLKVAILERDGNTLMWLKSLMENEIAPFPAYKWPMNRKDGTGIKSDMSFQQHGQLLYSGGYGEVFLEGVNRYIRFTIGTQFALSTESLNNYANFILDGMQFGVRGLGRDANAAGRGIVRNNSWKGNSSAIGYKDLVTESVKLLLKHRGLEREAELRAYIQNRLGDKDLGAGGHRYYYESDYSVYNDTKYMASVRHASNRTRVYEYLNGENPYAYYTGLGATFYYVEGDEYRDIFPVYDWNKIPGTTTRQGVLPKLSENKSYNLYAPNVLVSGVSNGKIGASYTRQIDHTVTSTQAYFMFEDGVVCLGNGINTWMPEEVVTSINQTRLVGDVILCSNGNRTALSLGDKTVGKFDYVYHNKISYIMNGNLNVSLEHRAEDYKKTNTHSSSWIAEEDVFTIYKSYGKRPTAAKYDYTVLMDTTPDSTEEYLKNPTLHTLCNNTIIQAVYDSKNNITQAVFHGPSSLKLPDGRRLDISVAGVLILERIDGHDVVTICSNSYNSLSCAVTVGGKSKIVTIGHEPVRVVL